MRLAIAALVLLTAAPACAEPTPFRLTGHERIPARISDALVAAPLLVATVDAWRADDRGRAFARLGCRNGVGILLSEGLKRLVHRERPDRSDRLSFPSGHTMLADVNSGRGWSYGVTLGVAWGRMAGGRHYATDVAGGAAIGELAKWVCR